MDPTVTAGAGAAPQQSGRTPAPHPSLLRRSVLWNLPGEIDWYNGVLCKV